MKTTLKCLLLLLFLVLMTSHASAQVNTPYKPVCDIDQIDKLVGTVSLSLGIDRVVTPTMSCLLNLWRDDKGGNTRFVVSAAFLSILGQNPQRFFSTIANEPKIYAEWLGDLENLSFTWPFDPPCGLETTRKHLISIIQHSTVEGAKELILRDAVLKKLSIIRCRQIN